MKRSEAKCAVKIVRSEEDMISAHGCDIDYERVMDSFMYEIEIYSRIGTHPNVTQLLAIDDELTVIVLERGDQDLQAFMNSRNGLPLSLRTCQEITIDILTAISFLHSHSIAHLDVKPCNILLFRDSQTPRMTAKLCDFGISRVLVDESKIFVNEEICSLWYRAPEVIMGQVQCTSAVDEWSLGCVTLFLLLGDAPFKGSSKHVCRCITPSHVNYNDDQLRKIFKLVGTPSHSLLQNMECFCHFRSWNIFPSILASTVCAWKPFP